MKECKRISGLYGEIFDQQLNSVATDNALEHFRNCTNCREDFKWYGITVQALNSLEDVSPPEDFVAHLNSKLCALPAPRTPESYLNFFRNLFSSSPYLPLPVGAASLAFLVVVGFIVYNQAPVPFVPATSPMLASNDSGTRGAAPAVAADVQRGMRQRDIHIAGPVLTDPTFTRPTAPTSFRSAAISKSLGANANFAARSLNTVADRIGADNLTVESPRVDFAIESIKKILPDIKGKLVEEMSRGGIGERVIGIRIPSRAYAYLATELVNHGAVAVGAGSDAKAPALTESDANCVILYIRFVPSH